MFTDWNHAARGTVPLGWTISPLLRDIGPGILACYQQTSTANDLLVAEPDGEGSPIRVPRLERGVHAAHAEGRGAIRVLSCQLRRYFAGETEMTVAFRDALGQSRLCVTLVGAFVFTLEGTQANVTGGFPVTNPVSLGDGKSCAATLRNISDNLIGRGPLLITGALAALGMTPANDSRMAEQLGPEFDIVFPDT